MSTAIHYNATRVALKDAGYSQSDPAIRSLAALVDLAAAPPGLEPGHFPSDIAYRVAATTVSRHFGQIKRWLRIARQTGVSDRHLTSVRLPAQRADGTRPYGELTLRDGRWQYAPADDSHFAQHGTLRRAVISAIQSAIWRAERSNKKGKTTR